MDTRHHRGGFTLIEMMIAVTLGALIVSVAAAGFRVASQTVTLANRLSLQNAVLRTAVVAANEEMDFWESFDSRTDTTKQPLRGATYPFAQVDFRTPDTLLDFNPASPRLWWSGHLWSANRASDGTNYQRRLGDYSLFGRQGMTDIDYGPAVTTLYPTLASERSWRHNILPYLTNNLGYYAAFDYLPANFVFGCYDSTGDMPAEFGVPGVGPGRLRPNWHSGNKPLQKCEAGHDNGYIITNTTGVSGYPNTHPVCHRASYNDNGSATGFTDTLYPDRWNAFPQVSFARSLPAMWPSVWMQVKATYSWMDFRHQVLISQTDPYTGVSTSMTLYGMTTTLRGARRQRGLDLEPADPNYP
jgi:prepilin-type N-terminal cleavage/methylation domain-containing protein